MSYTLVTVHPHDGGPRGRLHAGDIVVTESLVEALELLSMGGDVTGQNKAWGYTGKKAVYFEAIDFNPADLEPQDLKESALVDVLALGPTVLDPPAPVEAPTQPDSDSPKKPRGKK
jgi:hypothetical protein